VAPTSDHVEPRAEGRDRAPAAPRGAHATLTGAVPLLGLWAALGVGLSAITGRVTDWFVMTDELLYERLAISIARDVSLIPRLRGVRISSVDQLYPLLIAPLFRDGSIAHDLHNAHLWNAWIMSSACIPAFLLARRVTGRLWPAYVLALVTVCMPWILYASFLLTEVAAYPAFVWALFAMQRASADPSGRNDLIALLAIALAFFARTQFIALAIVFPLALLAQEAAAAPRRRALKRAVAKHRLAAIFYALFGAVVIVLAAVGRVSSLLGPYADTIKGSLLPAGIGRAVTEHLATLALGLGILPFVVGVAWLLANLVRSSAGRELHAFACLGSITVVAIMLQVSIYDVRYGGFVHDRYLFYLVPLVLLAFICALRDSRRARWSLLAPTALVAIGFSDFALGLNPRLVPDNPIAALNDPILRLAGSERTARVLLVVATVVLAALFVQAALLFRRAHVAAVLVTLVVVALPAETAYTFDRLFRADSWSGSSLTVDNSDLYDWVDETLGTKENVTMVPYPYFSGDFWGSFPYWRNFEFWNHSVTRAAYYPSPGIFESTGPTFPKIYLRFDPTTGVANVSPTRWVTETVKESRFRIAGPVRAVEQAVLLIDAGNAWRADWLTSGLYVDGWTKPGVTARVRVFAAPGQRRPVTRYVSFQVQAPPGVMRRPVEVASNLDARRVAATTVQTMSISAVRVCVPAAGFAEVRLKTSGRSEIHGDLRDRFSFSMPRQGGVFLSQIALADEVGPAC
jgi:hypothetical protein